MTKSDLSFIISLVIFASFTGVACWQLKPKQAAYVKIPIIQTIKIEPEKKTIEVRLTGYHANIAECGNNKGICYDGSVIPDTAVNWCAVSPDLLYYHLNFGDTIEVLGMGKYIVHDKTSDRLRKTVDILLPDSVNGFCEKGHIIHK